MMPRLRPFARTLIAALGCSLALAGAAHAQTQTGAFSLVNGNWWVGPGSSRGFSITGSVMFIDMDGNGTNDEHHTVPFSATGWNFQLTPSRQFVYGSHAGIAPCSPSGATVRILQVIPGEGVDLVQIAEVCVPGGIAAAGVFDDPLHWPQRVLYVTDGVAAGTATTVHFVDLNTGQVADVPGFNPSISHVGFSPSGIAAMVRHEVNADAFADYDFIELCAGSGFGRRLWKLPMHHINVTTGTVGTRVDSSAMGFSAAIYYPNAATLLDSVGINACAPPPTLGACCLPLGGCTNSTTASYCASIGGTWAGAGTVCATAGCPPPPAPDLHVTLSGPPTGQAQGTVAYVIGYSNTGNAAATSVTLRDRVPTFATYLRASNGGGFSGIDGVWSLGTVAAGAVGVCSLYVTAPCNRASIVNDTYSITAANSPTVNGTGSVTTTLTGYPTTALDLSLVMQPLATPPLQTGGRVRYTLSMTNTLGVPRPGTHFGLNAGNYCTMDTVLQSGGGVATIAGDFLSWTGTLAPLATATVVFETHVTACRPPGPGFDLLNRALGILVSTPCSNSLGVVLPRDTLRLTAPPVAVSVSSPALGAVQDFGTRHAVGVRAGGPADFHFDVSNTDATVSPAVSASLVLGGGLSPVGNPPFVGSPPAGTTWDAGTSTITWQGTVPAHDTVHVVFRASVDTAGTLMGSLAATGDVDPCFGTLAYTLFLVGMKPETTDPHLLGLSRYEGLWTQRPGVDAFRQHIVGFDSDTQNGLTRTDTGDLWVVGSPSWRANPGTGLFEILAPSLFTTLGMDFPGDVAFDSVDHTLVFAGYQSGKGLRVTRWNPVTHVATPLYTENSTAHGPATHVKIAPTRRVVVTSGRDLLWIDPAVPGVATVFRDTSYKDLPALAVDTDGNYLVVEGRVPTGSGRVASVNRTTGVFTVLHGGDTLGTLASTTSAIVVSSDGSLYGAFDYGSLFRFTRGAWAFQQYAATGYNDDLEWVGPPAPGGVGPEPGAVVQALAFASPAPNPTAGAVALSFALPVSGHVRIAVYDLGGRRVRELANASFAAGVHRLAWDGRDAGGRLSGAGLYFVRLETAAGTRTQRLVIAR